MKGRVEKMSDASDLVNQRCVPCEGGIPPMSDPDEEKYLKNVPEWELDRTQLHRIRRKFVFDDFVHAIEFVNKVAKLAENEGHHPDIYIFYDIVKLELYTHAVKGLSLNDFILAAKINAIQ
jgi:4a-hydroxytetrahydrobiopterin dehydratase